MEKSTTSFEESQQGQNQQSDTRLTIETKQFSDNDVKSDVYDFPDASSKSSEYFVSLSQNSDNEKEVSSHFEIMTQYDSPINHQEIEQTVRNPQNIEQPVKSPPDYQTFPDKGISEQIVGKESSTDPPQQFETENVEQQTVSYSDESISGDKKLPEQQADVNFNEESKIDNDGREKTETDKDEKDEKSTVQYTLTENKFKNERIPYTTCCEWVSHQILEGKIKNETISQLANRFLIGERLDPMIVSFLNADFVFPFDDLVRPCETRVLWRYTALQTSSLTTEVEKLNKICVVYNRSFSLTDETNLKFSKTISKQIQKDILPEMVKNLLPYNEGYVLTIFVALFSICCEKTYGNYILRLWEVCACSVISTEIKKKFIKEYVLDAILNTTNIEMFEFFESLYNNMHLDIPEIRKILIKKIEVIFYQDQPDTYKTFQNRSSPEDKFDYTDDPLDAEEKDRYSTTLKAHTHIFNKSKTLRREQRLMFLTSHEWIKHDIKGDYHKCGWLFGLKALKELDFDPVIVQKVKTVYKEKFKIELPSTLEAQFKIDYASLPVAKKCFIALQMVLNVCVKGAYIILQIWKSLWYLVDSRDQYHNLTFLRKLLDKVPVEDTISHVLTRRLLILLDNTSETGFGVFRERITKQIIMILISKIMSSALANISNLDDDISWVPITTDTFVNLPTTAYVVKKSSVFERIRGVDGMVSDLVLDYFYRDFYIEENNWTLPKRGWTYILKKILEETQDKDEIKTIISKYNTYLCNGEEYTTGDLESIELTNFEQENKLILLERQRFFYMLFYLSIHSVESYYIAKLYLCMSNTDIKISVLKKRIKNCTDKAFELCIGNLAMRDFLADIQVASEFLDESKVDLFRLEFYGKMRRIIKEIV